jgi:hypothetical protein
MRLFFARYLVTASRFNGGLSLRGEFFSIGLRVCHVDFSDE